MSKELVRGFVRGPVKAKAAQKSVRPFSLHVFRGALEGKARMVKGGGSILILAIG